MLAFVAGLLSVASPCVLPLVPLYLAYLTGSSLEESGTQTGGAADGISSRSMSSPFLHSVAFVVGFSAVFVALGASVGVVGWILRDNLTFILRVAGILLIVMGLHMAGLITIPALNMERRLDVGGGRRLGLARSFLVGAAFSVGWSPCVGPTLGSIFALAVSSSTVASASLLLLIYSAGLAIPFLLMGLAYSRVRPMYRWLRRYSPAMSYASGAFLVLMGVMVFTDSVSRLNSYFDVGFPGTSV